MLSYKEYLIRMQTINEMAYKRKDAFMKFDSIGDQILFHMIKVLYYEDELNYNKHIKDIETWIKDLQRIRLKPNNRIPNRDDLYDWLLVNKVEYSTDLKPIIDHVLKEYHNLPILIDINQLHDKLQKFYITVVDNWDKKLDIKKIIEEL